MNSKAKKKKHKMHGRKQSMKENVQPSPSIWHLLELKDSFDYKCLYKVFFMNIQTRTATEICTMTHRYTGLLLLDYTVVTGWAPENKHAESNYFPKQQHQHFLKSSFW